MRFLQMIWKSLALKLGQRLSLSDYLPLGNEKQKKNQEGTNVSAE